jgi:hypothetical protein
MSFLKKLFGLGGDAAATEEKPGETQEHEGFTIVATPIKEGGQFQVAGIISKAIDGETKTYKFLRVDRFNDRVSCVELIFMKGKQIIAEQGERIFR